MDIFETIFKLIICHLLGDFFLQTQYVAETKGKNWYHLFVHCILYSVPFYFCFGWCWQLALIAILHFPIDALKARYQKINIITDQTLHYLLCLTYFL